MSHKHFLLLAMGLMALNGCQKESAPPAAAQSGGQASTDQAGSTEQAAASDQPVVAVLDPAVSVTPSSVTECDAIEATVHWDATKAGVNTSDAEVWVSSPGSTPQLFAAGGPTGDAETGAWVVPGVHFILKSKSDGQVLGEAIVGGPACSG